MPNGFAIQHWKQFLNIWNLLRKEGRDAFFHYFFHRYPSVRCCQFTAGHRDHFRPFRADAFSVRPSPYGSRYRLYFFGGMKSAAVSGILKMVIIWISLFISGAIAFLLLQENNTLSSFPASHFDLMGQGTDSAMAHLFSVIVGVLCTQTYIQCIFSAGTPLKAASGCFIAALIVIPIGLPSVAVGMYMHAAEPGTLPILVLPTFLVNHVPVLIGGLAMSGIILSLLGSIGGLSLGIGTMISHDILSPLLKITDEQKASPPDKADCPCRHDSGIPYRHHEQGDGDTFLELSFHGTPGRRHLPAFHACCFLAGSSQCGLGSVLYGGKYHCRYHRRIGKASF